MHLCGLMSGDGRVVRYEVSSAEFGCGSKHNESDWGVFVCGLVLLCILRLHIYSMCVLEILNNIFSLPVSGGDKGWLFRLQPQWQWEMSKSLQVSQKYTPTQLYAHGAESDYLINYEFWEYFCIVQCVCQGEANCAKYMLCAYYVEKQAMLT